MSTENENSTASTFNIPPNFDWSPDYDALLEQIATTDIVDYEWTKLRDILKYKIKENMLIFLAFPPPSAPPPFSLTPSTPAGLKILPLPPKKRDALTSLPVPPNRMTESEATEMLKGIFELLHGFDEGHPPFTIQRLCELCLRPTEHYNVVGKYLRAVEKSLLVTSTLDAFPPLPVSQAPFTNGVHIMGDPSGSAPPTPTFSPITFLHRSPSPSAVSPAILPEGVPANVDPLSLNVIDSVGMSTNSGPEQGHALGLVDELDDPNPGHMSERPTALTAVTTVGEGVDPLNSTERHQDEEKSAGFIETLESRFVPSQEETGV